MITIMMMVHDEEDDVDRGGGGSMIATGDEFEKCKTRSLNAVFSRHCFPHISHYFHCLYFENQSPTFVRRFFLLWQRICRRNLGTLLVCQSSFDLLQDFAEPPDKIRPVPSLFDSDLWSQLTADGRQSVFHLETVTTHWSVNVTMPCFGRILSRTFPPTWFSDWCQKQDSQGKVNLPSAEVGFVSDDESDDDDSRETCSKVSRVKHAFGRPARRPGCLFISYFKAFFTITSSSCPKRPFFGSFSFTHGSFQASQAFFRSMLCSIGNLHNDRRPRSQTCFSMISKLQVLPLEGPSSVICLT